ncbi:ABC-2 family transporter protein [Nocardiopsis sp. CNT-189]|uniref:ABC transporter permease n=1 Tax=Nocardiopsis oceanisediminis TaxID=2816862 RepID=UPI003B33D33F
MRLYRAVFANGLHRHATYRAATAAGLLTNTAFGLINAGVLLALFDARPRINGYDAADAITHVFITQALLAPTAIIGPPLDLGERIRTGDITTDLLRPAHPLVWWLADDLGRAAFQTAFRGAPTFTAGALLLPLDLPAHPATWAAFTTAATLAVLIGFALRYLFALAGFWLLDTRGLASLLFLAGPAFSGVLLPLVLFPDPLATAMRALPWASMIQFPVEVLLGKHTPPDLAAGLAQQAAWAAALLALGALATTRATRKTVIQGG